MNAIETRWKNSVSQSTLDNSSIFRANFSFLASTAFRSTRVKQRESRKETKISDDAPTTIKLSGVLRTCRDCEIKA